MVHIPSIEPLPGIYRGSEGATAFQLVRQVYRQLGFRAGFFYLLYRFLPLPRVTVKLRHPAAKYPVYCRMGTTDMGVFRLIFGMREYDCLDEIKNPALLLDCGANVGYASVYFLSRFPQAYVVAVEPDPENFAMLQKNLAPFAGRYTAFHSAVWSRKASVAVRRNAGGAAAITVTESPQEGEVSLESMTIGELMAGRSERIAILKIDIEGAEKELFSANYDSWLARTDNIVIELHDEEARRIFGAALEGQNFSIQQHGELTVCTRLTSSI